MVSVNGTNKLNLNKRAARGQGIIRDIIHILEGSYFSDFYFNAAILLRNALLISVLMNQCEIWYNVTQADIKILEAVDSQFLHTIFQASSKTNTCLIMLELGVYPLRITLKMRRLGYLHHLLTCEDDTLARQVFMRQLEKPVKGDWTNTVQNDLKELNINMSLSDISLLTKKHFKIIVKKACIEYAFNYLVEQTSKLSKGSEILHAKLNMQSYLQPGNNLSVSDMRTIFMMRMRNLNLKCNYPSMYDNRKCIAPQCMDEDSQFHIYSCKYLDEHNSITMPNNSYYDIFTNNVERQYQVMQIMIQHYITREKMLSSQASRDDPADPEIGNISGIRGERI